eukprot:SAG11_NODE_3677_length_2293_cov_3.032361_4_plen_168_part_01
MLLLLTGDGNANSDKGYTGTNFPQTCLFALKAGCAVGVPAAIPLLRGHSFFVCTVSLRSGFKSGFGSSNQRHRQRHRDRSRELQLIPTRGWLCRLAEVWAWRKSCNAVFLRMAAEQQWGGALTVRYFDRFRDQIVLNGRPPRAVGGGAAGGGAAGGGAAGGGAAGGGA